MKRPLHQFDTGPMLPVLDNVVAYEGGADHVTAGSTPAMLEAWRAAPYSGMHRKGSWSKTSQPCSIAAAF